MKLSSGLAVLSAWGVVSLGVVPAHAAVVYYTDPSAWNEALTVSPPVITFDSVDGQQVGIGIPLSVGGLSFTGISTFLTAGQLMSFGTGPYLRTDPVTGTTQVRVDLPTGTTAFSTRVMAQGIVPHPDFGPCCPIDAPVVLAYTMELFNGATSLGSYSGSTIASTSTHAFVGFTSDVSVTQIFFTPTVVPNTRLLFDNVAFGTAQTTVVDPPSAVPETSALWLTAAGMLAIGWKGWRRMGVLAS